MGDAECAVHGYWDPRVGYKRCPGCASAITAARLGEVFYAMHPLDAHAEVMKDAMRVESDKDERP